MAVLAVVHLAPAVHVPVLRDGHAMVGARGHMDDFLAPVDLTETGSEMLHTNMAPTQSLMKLPEGMKDGALDISSRGTFTIGVDTEGQVSMWGYYFNTLSRCRSP